MKYKTAADQTDKVVAIVRYGPPSEVDGMRPGEYFQVTLDPHRFSANKEFIRLGLYPGDELVGWQRAKSLVVVDILGAWEGDNPPIMSWTSSGAITI